MDGIGTDYQITPSRFVKSVTWSVISMFLGLSTLLPVWIYTTERDVMSAGFTGLIMLAIYIPVIYFTWGYAPQKYVLGEEGVGIIRPIKSVNIPMNTITKVEDKTGKRLGLMKKVGNNGLFGFTGSFYNKEDGTFYMYAKNANYIMIHADKKYVVSPDEKDLFYQQLIGYVGKYGKKEIGIE